MGRTCLHYAIFGESSLAENEAERKGFETIIKHILSYSPNLTLCDEKRGWNAVFQAVGGGTLHFVDMLIKSGDVRLDALDKGNESLLHTAVRYNRFNVLKYLLTQTNHRWNLLHKNLNDETPFELAVMASNIKCLLYLIEYGPMSVNSLMDGLLLAVKNNIIDVVKLLMRECKVDPNFVDKDDMTPLRWAVFNGFKSVCKELLIGGAQDEVDPFGQNIVFYAAKNNHLHILQLLQKANADFCVVNFEGQTATDKTDNAQIIQFIRSVRNIQVQYHN